jgi:hypothetical protein
LVSVPSWTSWLLPREIRCHDVPAGQTILLSIVLHLGAADLKHKTIPSEYIIPYVTTDYWYREGRFYLRHITICTRLK